MQRRRARRGLGIWREKPAGPISSSWRFLIGDAISCAKAAQKVPEGYYNLELMLRAVRRGGEGIAICGNSMDARGIADAELVSGL